MLAIILSIVAILISGGSLWVAILAHRMSKARGEPALKVSPLLGCTRTFESGYSTTHHGPPRKANERMMALELVNVGHVSLQVEHVGVLAHRDKTPLVAKLAYGPGHGRLPFEMGPGVKAIVFVARELEPAGFDRARRIGAQITTGQWFWSTPAEAQAFGEGWRQLEGT